MKRIKSFENYISEKLGIVSNLEPIADHVLSKLEEKNYYQLETRIRDYDVTIEFYVLSDLEESGSFSTVDLDKRIFKIKLKKLNKSTLIHELKHLDRFLVRNTKKGLKYESRSIMTHITNFVTKNFSHFFKDKESAEMLSLIIYYSNPDEFESHFNGIYHQLKNIISEKMSKEEKIKLINEELQDEAIYIFYRYFSKNEFDIRYFFKSNRDMNQYLSEYRRFLESFTNQKVERISIWNQLFSHLKKWINSKLDDVESDNSYQEFNKKVNVSVQKNYRKFNRLYSLLVL
jgi:hypothetical protein